MGIEICPDNFGQRLASNWNKFRLLTWKNFTLQWRHKIRTCFEIFVPIIFSILLIYVRSLVKPTVISNTTNYESFDIEESLFSLRQLHENAIVSPIRNWQIVFYPKNSMYWSLMKDVSDDLKLRDPIGVSSPLDLEILFLNRSLLAGVEFNDFDNATTLPKVLKYSLRFPSRLRMYKDVANGEINFYNWKTTLLFPSISGGDARDVTENQGGTPWYNREGFLPIQNSIARNFIRRKGKFMPHIKMKRFPAPPHLHDILLNKFQLLVPIIIVLSFLLPAVSTVRHIGIEKENQLKVLMRIMGLPNWLHWTCWFFKTLVYLMIIISLMVVLLKVPIFDKSVTVFNWSHWSTIWTLFFVYSISITTFCFTMSTIFAKANDAATVTGFVWLLLYLPFPLTEPNYEELTLLSKILICFSPNAAMGYGINFIIRWESTGEGLNWSNWMKPVSTNDNLSIATIIMIMLITSIVQFVLAIIIERMNTNEPSLSRFWKSIFRRFFLLTYSNLSNDQTEMRESHLTSNLETKNFEEDIDYQLAGIICMNLRKVYDNNVAVKGLTMKMFNDQITVLLGNNGAGKSSTMSMLTGITKPTSGTAFVNGFDIQTNLEQARNSIGICLQQNILFDDLTVKEHIQFFCQLKNFDCESIDYEVNKYISKLGLESKANALSKTLSGGMKRKLSVVLALCGKSNVVLCDEPTSGMDPLARRELWNLLQAEKKDRTIVISTHFMDEADALGDRIAIMSNGEMKCSGTSFYLKNRFGSGYNLICSKGITCNSNEITQLLRKFIPNVDVHSDIGQELCYKLPRENVDIFKNMLEELENKQNALDLNCFGLSLITLEDVFMKICSQKSENCEYLSKMNEEKLELKNGLVLIGYQIFAMFKKRYILWKRSMKLNILMNIITVIIVIASIFVARAVEIDNSLPPLTMDFNGYGKSQMLIESDNQSLIASNYIKLPESMTNDVNIKICVENMGDCFMNEVSGRNRLVGVQVLRNEIIGWFNAQPLHTAPLSLNSIHNAIIHTLLDHEHGIQITNKPMTFFSLKMSNTEGSGFYLAIYIGLTMALITSFHIIIYIKERKYKAKHIQTISGVGGFAYWTTSFIVDFINITISQFLMIITLVSLHEEFWTEFNELFRLFLIFIMFNFASIPQLLIASNFFTVPSSGFNRMLIFNMLTGTTAYFVIFTITPSYFGIAETVKLFEQILHIFPHYALVSSINSVYNVTRLNHYCQSMEVFIKFCDVDYFSFEHNGVGRSFIYMIVIGLISFLILMLQEMGLLQTLVTKIMHKMMNNIPTEDNHPIDSDILLEKKHINQLSLNEISKNNLVLRNFTKYYGNNLSVNRLSVAIGSNECFGLLGANGAGKTTTFKMLTGDENIIHGDGWVRGISIKKSIKEVYKSIGYCPQFDGLIDDLTGRETLEMIALLRGIPRSKINDVIETFAHDLNFTEHIDKKIYEYSGGNKRKLSTAIAMCGNPEVIYLDEPSTGMDPMAKRNLWKVICSLRKMGKSIILSSHSMEECEALCTRLAIMVNGEFKCLGSIQHLKNKYPIGFILVIKVKQHDEALSMDNKVTNSNIQVKNFVEKNFIQSELREEFQGLLTYYISPANKLRWSKLFGIMEECQRTLEIEDYFINQTSLEQVFLSLAKKSHR